MSNIIIQKVVDELNGKEIYEFDVPIRQPKKPMRTFIQWMKGQSKPEVVNKRFFRIYPTVVSNQLRIAAKALTLPKELFDEEGQMLEVALDHLSTLVYIIAAAIQNDKNEPSEELIEFLSDNLDNIDIANIITASMQATNMQSFSISIVLMRGTEKVLQTKSSPLDGSELIASHIQE